MQEQPPGGRESPGGQESYGAGGEEPRGAAGQESYRTRPPTGPTGPGPSGGSGLAPNVAGALSYLLGAITGILFLLIDKDRPFVRFHAAQSIAFSVVWLVVWVGLTVLGIVLSAVPVLGWLVNLLLTLALVIAGFGVWIYLMYQAFQGNEWELPVVGEQVRQYLPRLTDSL